ncbi:DNA sulfur modification protein DndB [Kangiella sediminilitoris]|uniref:DGQHR domain protein n=1 Tax=Kangiella sediminilitoris TaxID=1144748 RepID=A0A1B3B9N6_9GAMM|nr:DNA sulfur modification protein DndB [Kangiella sediminilitoris]AOE49514.1 hypothetical protein KS2013_790 [Kangiella sediminilitoris]
MKPFNPTIQRDLTNPITYLKGEYSLHKYTIPYFSVVLPMSFIAEQFTLIDEIPNSERIEWTLQELFQRDIAWERVDEGLVKYLQNESIQQFFNSLTVALLPKKGHGLADKYDESEHIASLGNEFEEPVQVGGCSVQAFEGSNGLAGKILWDKKEIAPIAVDGQHRLAAIKQLVKKIHPDKLAKTFVPVILIIPHKNLNYTSPVKDTESVFSSLRKIFIDLNQNAKPVSRARNILLNDSDIVSICTRSLIGSKLTTSKEDNKVHLGLVDWVSEKNKFETGPFITTLLILSDIVSNILKINNLKEPQMEYDPKIKNWVKNIFKADAELTEDIMEQVRYCYNQEIPLTFKPEQLIQLRDSFEKLWSPWIHKLFTELSPYKELTSYVEEHQLHSPELVNLYIERHINEGERAIRRANDIKDSIKQVNPNWNIKEGFERHIQHIDDDIKLNNWFFKVVFQKALFNSFINMKDQSLSFGIENDSLDKDFHEYTELWISAINKLVESDLHMTDSSISGVSGLFWSGISLNAEKRIEYTKVGSSRIESWLNAWVAMYYLSDAEEGIPTLAQLRNNETLASDIIVNCLFENKKVKKGFEILVAARNDNFTTEQIEDKTKKEINSRYNALRKLLST